MLTDLGRVFLPWFDDVVLERAIQALLDFDVYVERWRELLDV